MKKSKKETYVVFIAFLLIALLAMVFKFFSFHQIESIYNLTSTIYEHPLKVSNASLTVKLDVYKIHRDMKDIVLSSSQEELQKLIEEVNNHEKRVYNNLSIIEKNILGKEGLELQKETFRLFQKWKPIRDKVIALVKNNQVPQAISITKGEGAEHVLKLESSSLKLYTYAKNKADSFKNEADVTFDKLNFMNYEITMIILLLFMGIVYFTLTRLSKYIDKSEHLAGVLAVIRDVNQLIVREKEVKKMIQESCDILASNHVYENTWIMLLNDKHEVQHIVGSDSSENFKSFVNKVKNGWNPYCIEKTDEQFSFIENTAQNCTACTLKGLYNGKGAFNIELKHNNKRYGYLNISVDKKYISDDTELSLLDEVAGDIAYALYNIDREQVLIQQEERYRYVTEAAADGIWDWDLNTNDVYFSPSLKAILGYKDDEMDSVYEEWENRIHPDDKEQIFSDVQEAVNKKTKIFKNIQRLKHRDGHWVWIESRAVTLFDDEGKATRMVGSHTDISEQKAYEQELIELQQFSSNIIDSVDNLIFVKDVNSKYITCNKAYANFVGMSRENIIGKSDYDFYDKEMADSFIKYDKEMLIQQKSQANFEWDKDVNGQEYYMLTSKSPLLDNSGNIIGLVGNCSDLTEQNHLNTLLQNAQYIAKLGSWEQNSRDNTLFWSDEAYRIFEADPKHNMTYEQFMDRVHPDDRSAIPPVFQESIDEHKEYYLEHRLLFPDGRIKHVVERAEHSYDENNNHIRTIGTVLDVTELVLAINEIEKRDEILTSVFQVIPDLLFIMEKEGKIIDYRAKKDTGLYIKPELFLGKFMPDILPQDVGEVFKESLKNISENSELTVFKYELEIEGEMHNFEARMAQLPVDNNVMTIVRDITEQTSYQQQLVFQSQLLEQSLAATDVINEEGKFSYVNKAYVDMWGYDSKEEILETSPLTHCADPKMPQKIIEKVEKKGEDQFIFKAQKKDGTTFDALMTVKYFHHMDKKYYVGSTMDITENQEYLKEIQQKKQELETIIQEAPNPIILHNEDGKILMLNQAWVNSSGFSLEDTPTINAWLENIYDDTKSRVLSKKHIESLYQITEKVNEGNFTFLNKKREEITWQFSSAPLGVIDGKRTIIASAMDITELKQKDEMLINQSRHAAMGEMIGMIAHQWRQPLSVISMDANNMLLDIALDDFNTTAAEEHANSIIEHTQHLSKTIDDFRNFFKPDKKVSKVNIEKILDQTLTIVKDSLRNNNIELNSTFETDTEVDAYERELMQVFVNIITNAKDVLVSNKIKNAQIDIRVYEDEEYVNTQICDNGGGIDAAILPKVFDPYFSTKDEKTGTGLGLYMSKMIIEEHLKGVIEVSNSEVGACFTVRLLKKSKEG